MIDLCIVGCGASAMAAAVSFGENAPSAHVLVLEKKEQPGKKLAASGNGKCNLSNTDCPGAGEILDFFAGLGIWTRTDSEGRIYPYSEQARDVVFALRRRMEQLGIRVVTDCTVTEITKLQEKEGFCIKAGGKSWKASKVLLAAGGKASPQFGTAGDGYTLARSLGHRVTKLAPVLTAVECSGLSAEQKGVRVKAGVILTKDGKPIFEEKGEVQFTGDGLSGICIFNLSRFLKSGEDEPFMKALGRYRIVIDFVPEMDRNQVKHLLQERWENGFSLPRELLLTLVPEKLTKPLWNCCREKSGADGADRKDPGKSENTGAFTAQTAEFPANMADILKGWELAVSGVKGWKNAQCTAGGVSLAEIDEKTMESKLVKNLYFAGEITDYDGPCGGYNLQYAWETGIRAGRAMSERR